MASSPQPWTDLYPFGVGAELELEHPDMLSVFRACRDRRGDSESIRYFDQGLTYAALDEASNALACWLQDRGVSKGDRVSIIAQNLPAFPILAVAAWKLGAVPVPGNPMYRPGEMARILEDARPSAVLCQDIEFDQVAEAVARAGLSPILITTSPRDFQGRDDDRILPPRIIRNEQPQTLMAILDQNRARKPAEVRLTPDDMGLLLYTSGTTGAPKGAMLSHRSLAFNAQFMRDWCRLGNGARILAIAPLFHIIGFVCHICAAFSAGCNLLLNYRFEPPVVLDVIRQARPTFTIGAITAFNALMRHPGIGAADMASFEAIYSGGAPIPPALRGELKERLGISVYPCYGMTETAAPALFTPLGADVPARDGVLSIGAPIPSTDAKIVDDEGRAVGVGTAGELLIRGPQVMQGYWRKPNDSAAALADGWMHTGDVGFMDEEGWFYLVDRKKDVIIASGFKVWPREVEDVLYEHAAVREAAVVGVPDAYRGETVKAFVSLKPGSQITQDALTAHCRERLAAYKVPRMVEVLPDLPKTATGKIQRGALR